jgi:hypothetical protein
MSLDRAPLLLLAQGCHVAAVPPEVPPDTAGVEEVGTACDGLPRLVLNEILPANYAGRTDADGETSDWIEIANLDAASVDLEGWGLSEDADAPRAWVFPSLPVEPGGVVLVFASGKDRSGSEIHTDFALDASNPRVLLSTPQECVVDEARPGRMYAEVSWGRTLANPEIRGFFLDPTPGEPNTTEARAGFVATPSVSPAQGFRRGPVTVSLASGTPGAVLRYTLDGHDPSEASTVYEGPFPVDADTQPVAVRARGWADGLWPSRTATATYGEDPGVLDYGLDVVSLVVDPDDLWDPETGIYVFGPPDYQTHYPYFGANFWEDWERPVHVAVWEPDGTLVLDQDAGIQIHGGYTRAFNQKSFRVNARSGYGPGHLTYAFFPKEEREDFENIVLEGAGDWCPTHTENAFPDEIFRNGDGVRHPLVQTQAWEPCVVLLNGTFWGLYAFREQLDESYVEARYDADPDDLDRIECTADGTSDWWRLQQGTWDAFDEMNTFVHGADLSDPDAWDTFLGMVDVENLAATTLVTAYAEASDWWYNNLRLWRERTGPFRWMPFDFGHGWNSYTYDHIGVSAQWRGPGLPIADALENESFVVLLANEASDFLNTSLDPAVALGRLDEMHARIRPAIPDQYALWCGQPPSTWESSVDYARTFVQERPEILRYQVASALGLAGSARLTLEAQPPGSGTFRLTVVEVEPPFTGLFYLGIPITVTALPAEGWAFAGWSEGSDEVTTTLTLDGDATLTAWFE